MSVNDSERGGRWVEARAAHHYARVSADQVYAAWLDPAKVREWLPIALKSLDLEGIVQRVEIEPHVGGRFCFSDLRHGTEAVHRGEYLELARPRRIAFTWIVGDECEGDDDEGDDGELPSQVTLTIEPEATGCTVTIVHQMDRRWADYVARTQRGWTRMLKAIERFYQSAAAS